MKFIDDFLNNITMYRLVLYFLILLAGVGFLFTTLGIIAFNPIDYVYSFAIIISFSWLTNKIFAYVFDVPTNVESVWISALILGLILNPPKSLRDAIFVAWAGILAMALKYILTINKKHIFNPVAISVMITSLAINSSATWWVGRSSMLPIVAIGGFLIVRKIRRWDVTLNFLMISIAVILFFGLINGTNIANLLRRSIVDTPLIFFASIMITEPLTMPPTKTLRIIYGALVGFLFAPQIHLGSFYTTPEIALVIGNIYSYFVSPKLKLILKLKSKLRLTDDIYDFVFDLPKPITFKPGQYMEFTLDHSSPDDRGNRRYLSLASSPTEGELRIGVKFANPPSSFKRALMNLSTDQKIVAGQLIGDFTIPSDPNKKLAFIAGGIGITPYRSILKYLVDRKEKRDIVVIYSAKSSQSFVYQSILAEAEKVLGIKTIFNDAGSDGYIDATRLAAEIPDYRDRTFYISGSRSVVDSFKNILKRLGVHSRRVVTDYFPGFA